MRFFPIAFPNALMLKKRIEFGVPTLLISKGWIVSYNTPAVFLDLTDRSFAATKTIRMMKSSLANETLKTELSSQKEKPKKLILHSIMESNPHCMISQNIACKMMSYKARVKLGVFMKMRC